jgi:6-phosphofructokinase
MKPIRTIGIVNGGGDAPELNPAIRAIVRASTNEHAMRVVGVLNSFDGLIWPEGAKEMTEESVSGILPRALRFLAPRIVGIPSRIRLWKMAGR